MKDIIVKFLTFMLGDLVSNNDKLYQILLASPGDEFYGASSEYTNPFYSFYSSANTGLTGTLEAIATTMCGVFFVIELIKVTVKMEDVKFEYVLAVGLKFATARLAITMGSQLLTALTETANLVIADAKLLGETDLGTNKDIVIDGIGTLCKKMGTLQCIGVLATLVIPFLAVKGVGIVGVVMAYGRLFELTLLKIMYPIPVGAAFLDQGRITKRFFAQYFAVCMQGAFMIIATRVFQFMANDALAKLASICDDTDALKTADYFSELGSLAFGLLLASLILLLGMMKSGQWASKIVGEA